MLATAHLIRRIRKSTTTDRPALEFHAVKNFSKKIRSAANHWGVGSSIGLPW